VFLLFVLSLFHRCADGSWSAWLLLCFPIRQANGLITSSAALEGGKPNMKGGMLLVLHMPGQNHFVYRDPHDAGFGLQHLVCWPKAFGLPAIFLHLQPGYPAYALLVLKACTIGISILAPAQVR